MPGVFFAFSPDAGEDENGTVWEFCVAIVVLFPKVCRPCFVVGCGRGVRAIAYSPLWRWIGRVVSVARLKTRQ